MRATSDRFQVTEEHVKLLQSACTSWDGCEFGAPTIDCKRPYGNSNVLYDIAEILGIAPEADGEFSVAQEDHMRKVHGETETALQILLFNLGIAPGTYQREPYRTNWRPATPSVDATDAAELAQARFALDRVRAGIFVPVERRTENWHEVMDADIRIIRAALSRSKP